jgi:hypothetical protein
VALAVALVSLFAFAVAAAQADTQDIVEPQGEPATNADGWQAGTCLTDEPIAGVKCGPSTPLAFFKQAAGHPPVGFTQYFIKHEHGKEFTLPSPPFPPSTKVPIFPLVEPQEGREIKTLRVDLPPGLTVNPEATGEKCSQAELEHEVAPGKFVPVCKAATRVGTEEVTLVTNVAGVELELAPGEKFPVPRGFPVPPKEATGTKVPVFNIQPDEGEPALFGFVIAGAEIVYLRTAVAWESDYHESFTIAGPPPSVPFSTLISRLINNGKTTGNGTYLTTPTTCFKHEEPGFEHLYSTWFRAESWEEPDANFPFGSTPDEASLPAGVNSEGCEAVPFDPSIAVDPGTKNVDSPSPALATAEMKVEVPEGGEHEIGESHLRSAKVTLPQGMGINPSGAVGLAACTDAQFKKGQRVEENACPSNSDIGSAEIDTPVLSEPLKGRIYVGEQKSSDPTSGEEFRMLVEAKSKKLGIVVRAVGNVAADPTTGQLTATLNEQETGELAGMLPKGLPQAPFKAVKLHFDGVRSVLSTPPTCAPATTSGNFEPWSAPGSSVARSGSFTLSSIPGGGTCPTTLGARPFKPSYTTKSTDSKANAYSPFSVHIGRIDGEQELKVVNATLPPGLAGKLKGIPYCSDAALATAAGKTGTAEKASPSCPAASRIGSDTTLAGTGAGPLSIPGNAYLAGPYKGAPLSMAVITPATTGPFDLGTVVVRIALFVDVESTQVTAKSDVIPDVYGGVKLDVRSIDVNLDREKFIHNPTNCEAHATTGTLQGGGSDPTNPAAFSSFAFSTPYITTECKKLSFKPKLTVQLLGGRKGAKRRGHPGIKAVLKANEKDANIARTALTLPPTMLLDNAHIKTICTRVQLAAQECPKAAKYGKAEATSPLLEGKLKGPIYLVSSSNKLPDLVADLRGQINVQLHGVISTVKGGMKTTFRKVPDAPVTKFTLQLNGKSKGLIINSKDLCKFPPKAKLNIKGQNGKQVKNNKFKLKTGCPKKKHKK